jgi:uncharacterized protein (DUF2235 family)
MARLGATAPTGVHMGADGLQELDRATDAVGGRGIAEPAARAWSPESAPVDPRARNIVLFSDGTNNSSAKLFKTNVWRMYEAVDLGPTSAPGREQIAYYDDGVGTSGFKPVQILGGVFGQGLKRNVLDIYKFACRNYRPGADQVPGEESEGKGDLIYGFGFSRGAFTMRLAVALIADQGLVPYVDERSLDRQARAAYRKFREPVGLRYPYSPMTMFRAATATAGRLWRAAWKFPKYETSANWRPTIRFVGVWDTVAAYGGPIAEITRAIDNWIYPLSMPDYELNSRVQRARHALALDDERDSFQPLLWDEVAEEKLIRARQDGGAPDWIDARRLEQVWFTGMHADVGGGYPDESLSFVSLLWMIEEAHKAGLRTVDEITRRYHALASSLGPIHDSRSGLGSYYRYQPRRLQAWVEAGPGDNGLPEDVRRTLSLRDPTITDAKGRPRGLLTSVKVHESVIARIVGRKDYAPFVLPASFEIVPPGEENEKKPLSTSGSEHESAQAEGPALPQGQARVRLIDWSVREKLSPESLAALAGSLQPVWTKVWLRRATYFLTLVATFALLAMPLWVGDLPPPPILSDGRNWLSGPIQLLGIVVPRFLSPLVDTYSNNTFWFLLLVSAVLMLRTAGARLEGGLRDTTRRSWTIALSGRSPEGNDPGLLERIRDSVFYQRGVQVAKWHVLPNLFGLAMLGLIGWAALAALTQLSLPIYERGTALCPGPTRGANPVDAISADFDARSTCNPLHASLKEGATYAITFRLPGGESWFDSDRRGSPEGLSAGDLGFWGYVGVPLRRVTGGRYLQPMLMIRPDARPGSLKNVYIYPVQLRRDEQDPTLYSGEFTAKRSGQAYLFANDAVLPFNGRLFGGLDLRWFYVRSGFGERRGNAGTACVTLRRASYDAGAGVAATSPVCLKVAEESLREERKRSEAAETGDARRLYEGS